MLFAVADKTIYVLLTGVVPMICPLATLIAYTFFPEKLLAHSYGFCPECAAGVERMFGVVDMTDRDVVRQRAFVIDA